MGLSGILQKGRRVSEWFGRHQNWYLQLGIAGFTIAGVHLGADRIDDGCFVVLNFIDAGIDDLVARFFHFAQQVGFTSMESARSLSLDFADLVDVEAREAAARWVAIGMELWVDFLLGRAALGYREDPALGSGLLDMIVELGRAVKALAQRARELLDVEFIVLPLSLVIGLIASAYVVFVVSVETFNQLIKGLFGASGAVEVIATILAYVVTAMVLGGNQGTEVDVSDFRTPR